MTGDPPIAVTLENRLMSHGIYVLEVEWDEPSSETDFHLTYEVVTDAPRVTSDEVGTVVRTVLAIADERGWSPGHLEATSRGTDGSLRGRWRVERDWFDDLHAELTESEFSRRILETVTTGSVDE
ncbi:hypothetical protein [Natrialba swarupiae]|uniref:DUF8159 domain-containing protein n=1 Tax=Natrialba swarupiae TaxID=2448032 RepID=A0A5D5AQY4_9EURY|nr:hypothetical protein [Natrialba swarupiae]TYT61840.1 hypothetical protein FYC77_11400 [Natrialba swarupiae]